MKAQTRSRILRFFLISSLAAALLGTLTVVSVYLYLEPKLPPIETLKDVRLQVPLRVYTRDGELMAEYGEMKRVPLRYEQFPPQLVQAFLAAEDNRFFEHPGVDYQGLLRAAFHLIRTGERGQGGSTITMQVARNFFLSREKTYTRKINEILLSLKIERELSKEQILELYLNKIYLGKRAYGAAAAAQIYYGKTLAELNLAQLAMIAGLPKAPSAYNPIINPERAIQRRNYVLGRMHELEFIEQAQFDEAVNAPVTADVHTLNTEVDAPYAAEMVRAEMLERYGKDAYTYGYKVYTTIDARLQQAANQALHDNLLAYDRRHGFRGAEAHRELPELAGAEEWSAALQGFGTIGGLEPALVIAMAEKEAVCYLPQGELVVVTWDGLSWARPYLSENSLGAEPKNSTDILKVGDIVRLEQDGEGLWQLAQVPQVSGALVSLRPTDGALLAMTGGFDFFHSKFNRATQAERQPGSNFKPFIYSAALDNGYTLASIINDAPVVFEDNELESEWRPENYSGKFYGPTRLHKALVNSRNLVSIRLLQSIGIRTAINYVTNFGFDPERLSRDLSLALGSASITPYELVRGYATFANGGFLIEPYFIQRIEDSDGNVLYQADPLIACDDNCAEFLPPEAETQEAPQQTLAQALAAAQGESGEALPQAAPGDASESPLGGEALVEELRLPRPAPRTVEKRNVYLVRTMMQDVIRHGTGRRALQLGRQDLAGKTGTTNDQRDAWFSGYNNDVVTTVWVGFDTPQPLGSRETGARAALPMWIDYMREALRDRPEAAMPQPDGMVSARIDATTGEFTAADNPNAMFELFRVENVPQNNEQTATDSGTVPGNDGSTLTEQLF
jgi:penicillin-binding protein 1A